MWDWIGTHPIISFYLYCQIGIIIAIIYSYFANQNEVEEGDRKANIFLFCSCWPIVVPIITIIIAIMAIDRIGIILNHILKQKGE